MFDLTSFKESLTGALERFKTELSKVRTGRAHPDMLNSIKVEAYGVMTPLNQVSNITVSDATTLQITPFDISNLNAITSAIRADQALGLNPADDGRIVRIAIPPLTEERRKQIVKQTSEKVEEARISIRNARQDALKKMKGAELPEDVAKRTEKEIDELVKDHTSQVDELFKAKEAEILKV
jgi:ribosome recycling factor